MKDDRRVVVIGSGPAGASAAQALVRNGISVTMLEAGSRFQPGLLLRLGNRNLYRRGPEPRQENLHLLSGDPRTRWYGNSTPGGLSNCWTGAVPRFAPEDFTEGERLHERYRWPVDYTELAPYYEKVERRLAITADNRDVPHLPAGYADYQHRIPSDWHAVEQLANRYGQGFTTMPLADGPPTMLVRRGTAFNSFVNIVRPLLASPNFELRTGSQALQVQWSCEKGRADGVVYYDNQSKETKFLAANAVVIACGTLRTTKLLFASASQDFPEGLGNSNGLLGRFLHDHPREWWSFQLDRPLALLAPAAYLTRLPCKTSSPLLAASWTLGTATVKDKVRSRFGMKGTLVGVQVFGTMVPSETCFVRPSPQIKDSFGISDLEVRIQFDAATIDNVVHARQHLMNLLEEAGHKATVGEIDPTLYPGTSYHYGGTARMHRKPEYGVVDAWNRIHGAPNVLVCDASCFTTAVEKNPTLTVMALAARAADRLAHDLKHA